MGFGAYFGKLAVFAANHQFLAIMFCITLTGIMGVGILNVKLETDPQNLWVSHAGRTYKEQQYFNQNFGAFFRTDTFLMSNRDPQPSDNVFQKSYLQGLYYVLQVINSNFITVDQQNITADNLCYKPIQGKGCIKPSPMDYWKMNLTMMLNDNDLQNTTLCIQSNDPTTLIPCTDANGIPIIAESVFGAITCENKVNDTIPCKHCWVQAQALFVTYLLNNDLFTMTVAEQWEKEVFEETIFQFNKKNITYFTTKMKELYNYQMSQQEIKNLTSIMDLSIINFMAERSVEDELVNETNQNAWIVVLSYIIMFIYVSLAIGSFPSKVHSGFIIGLCGIFIVIASLLCGLGIMSYINIGVTLISGEVIPFLILAIGVDNMFIISSAVKHSKQDLLIDKIREGMTEVGPSITTAAISEILAFGVGAFTKMPALQTFCAQAAISVFFDYIFQITTFVAFLAWDENRKLKNKLDVIPCCTKPNQEVKPPRQDLMPQFFKNYYIPLLNKKYCHIIILVFFIGFITCAFLGCAFLQLGLDPQVSLISGSELDRYFDAYNKYVEVGPPAYLVLENIDYTNPNDIEIVNNLSNQLSMLHETVQPPVYSWVATFNQFISQSGDWIEDCGTQGIQNFPFAIQVKKFIDVKVSSLCCQRYGICGEQYDQDIIFSSDGNEVKTSRLRFMHKPVITNDNYINAFQQTRYIVDKVANFTQIPGQPEKTAFSYSLFYIYYDQYSFIRAVAVQNMLLAIAVVYLTTMLIKNPVTAAFVAFNVFCIAFNLIGMCWVLNEIFGGYQIEINAVSVVNLITSVGLAVEFCVHIMISYMNQTGTRKEKSNQALIVMGSNVLVGIATTKFIGVTVLCFASSVLFRLYYFRMYLCIIILGVFQGLMFLPVTLQYIGPMSVNRKVKLAKE